MTVSDYAILTEKKLIEDFKQNFFAKMGYHPVVITRFEVDGHAVECMPLDELKKCFEPFLPERYGRLLPIDAKRRYRELVDLRSMFCFLAKQMKYSLAAIGTALNNQDHTTVIHALSVFRDQMETSPSYKELFINILTHIRNLQIDKHESSILGTVQTAQPQSEPALLP